MAQDSCLSEGALDVAKVKRIMQVEAGCLNVNPDSTFLVTRAAELFLDALTARSSVAMAGGSNLEYEHVDVVPMKVLAGQLRADPRFHGKGLVQLPLSPVPGQQLQQQPVLTHHEVPQAQPQQQKLMQLQAQQQAAAAAAAQQQAAAAAAAQQQQQAAAAAAAQQQQLMAQQRQVLLHQQHMQAQAQQQQQLHQQLPTAAAAAAAPAAPQAPLQLTPEQQTALQQQQHQMQQQLYQQQLQMFMLQQQQLMASQQMFVMGAGVGAGGFQGADASAIASMGLRAPGDRA
ncbi:hypothetical protein GPECTOR_78g66 [Gonium pectorale]|uniref:Transcription factor CBF/NF-Y/archaeal histone domain-containing protein n=1 Tax=Gonium pectorale TaxID=33097 RepID=A0A150G213_GONPE|nr:hypothetical protein GPECTOR_78g66 [Gonium pectorale]|eukprot:KXZ43878.1 hypothetical protein GPECTOR_78g66 [Gonium pectorale]